MRRSMEVTVLTAALTACGGPPAGGQVGPSAEDPRGRLHVYEVAPEQVQQMPDTGHVEVSGTGTVMVTPDEAVVGFAMETRATSAAEAASANADAMERVLNGVRSAGFEGLELATYGYSLQPEYASNANSQRSREIVAYVARNNVRATISDVDAVGRLIDAAIGAGANRVASISFGASDTEEAEAEALAEAVRNARAQAEVIAQTLGRRLGPPLVVSGGAQRPMPTGDTLRRFSMAEAQAAPTPIEVEDQTVTAFVTIRFALGPELGG